MKKNYLGQQFSFPSKMLVDYRTPQHMITPERPLTRRIPSFLKYREAGKVQYDGFFFRGPDGPALIVEERWAGFSRLELVFADGTSAFVDRAEYAVHKGRYLGKDVLECIQDATTGNGVLIPGPPPKG